MLEKSVCIFIEQCHCQYRREKWKNSFQLTNFFCMIGGKFGIHLTRDDEFPNKLQF